MNLLDTFENGDIILGSSSDGTKKALWTIICYKTICLMVLDQSLDPSFENARAPSDDWTWTKIMTFNDFADCLGDT